MQFLVGIVLLGVIIAFHEFGHFVAAKLSGVGVMEFSIGMGPLLLWRRRGDTVYSLRAIPLGGYCAMCGEQSPEASVQEKKDGDKRKRRPNFKHDWTPKQSLTKASKGRQLLISLAGPGANILMAFVAALTLTALPGIQMGRPEIVDLGPVTVAEDAGVRVGDVVMRVNGTEIVSQQNFSTYMLRHPEVKQSGYTMEVYRPETDEYLSFFLVPDVETGLVGIFHRGQPLTGSISLGRALQYMSDTAESSLASVGALIRGNLGLSDVSGVVGITAGIGDSITDAVNTQEEHETPGSEFALVSTILSLMVLISIGLAVANLLPFPALDGGRALMTIGEMVTKKSIPEKVVTCVNAAGMVVLCGFVGLIMVSDIVKLLAPLFS